MLPAIPILRSFPMFDDFWWLWLLPLAALFWFVAGRPGRRRERPPPSTDQLSTRADETVTLAAAQTTQPLEAKPKPRFQPAPEPGPDSLLADEAELRAAYRAMEEENERRLAEREAADAQARLEAAQRAAEEAARAETQRRAAEAQARAAAEAAAQASALEAARLEAARQEAARLESERIEAERAEAQRREALRREAEAAAQAARERQAAEAAARAEAERQAAARLEAERQAAARLEAQRLEAERLEAERREAERVDRLRREAEREAAEAAARAEAARIEAQQRAAEESARADAERQRAAAAPARGRVPEETLVMVVDDSKVVRVKTSRLLTGQRYRVAVAEDGSEALRLMAGAPPDVLITDVEMPGMDGFELARHVRGNAATRELPIIMITSADDRLKQAAAEAGVTVLLGKPYPEEVLMDHIARLARVQATAPAAAT